jgi:exodeoxyribonuclease VII large subunit
MRNRVTQRITNEVQRLELLRSRPVIANPAALIDSRADELGRSVSRNRELIERQLERAQVGNTDLTTQLRALSPQRTLLRGYAIAQTADGRAVRDPAEAPAGTALRITVAHGALAATVDGDLAGIPR